MGYFAKQGFTKEITFERDRWHGWIKDYDGGTLMECIINPKVWGKEWTSRTHVISVRVHYRLWGGAGRMDAC